MTDDKTATQEAPQPGTPEYDKAMADKFDQSQDPANYQTQADIKPDVPALPEGGSDKFYNAETGEYDWKSHAAELQFKLEQKGGKKDEQSDDAKADDAEKKADDQTVNNVIETAGLEMSELASQIRENGKIEGAAFDKLVEAGIPSEVIEDYVGLARDKMERTQADAIDHVGGEDAWNIMSTWASDNLSDGEKAKYNEMLAGPDWKVAIDTLKSKMKSASPTSGEGQLRSGDSPGGSVVGFASQAEQNAAIQDERYYKDPAYRAQVAQKIAASKFGPQFR